MAKKTTTKKQKITLGVICFGMYNTHSEHLFNVLDILKISSHKAIQNRCMPFKMQITKVYPSNVSLGAEFMIMIRKRAAMLRLFFQFLNGIQTYKLPTSIFTKRYAI